MGRVGVWDDMVMVSGANWYVGRICKGKWSEFAYGAS